MAKTIIISLCLHAVIVSCFAQHTDTIHPRAHNKRVLIVAAGNAALFTASYIALNKAWYADYPKTKFHFFNDNAEWLQMDKAGHLWSAYQVSRASARAWKWAGLQPNTAAILGGAGGIVYQGIIEMQDAYSAQWGFSWGDIGANFIGSGAFVAQQIGWNEQRILIKMGYWPRNYSTELIERRNQIFGSTPLERVLKDYNSQTYWISANIASLIPGIKFPAWLNIAAGYGTSGMYGARSNIWSGNEGDLVDRSDISRERTYYLSPDIDLTRIHVDSKLLRSVFFVLNAVKIPAPALSLSNRGKLRAHVLK